jgi:hypothetical protein
MSDVTSCSPAMIGVGGPASGAGGKEYELDRKEPALVELAKIVRGADTNNRKLTLTPYSDGLAAIAAGFSVTCEDDYDNMEKQFPLYDALFGFCRSGHLERLLTSRH